MTVYHRQERFPPGSMRTVITSDSGPRTMIISHGLACMVLPRRLGHSDQRTCRIRPLAPQA